MSNLAQTGEMSYAKGGNKFTFPVETRTKVIPRVITDATGRSTKYVEYQFDVTSYLLDSPSDPTIAQVRELLNTSGGTFTFTGRGFSDIVVGPIGPNYDCKFGPVAKVQSLTPLGIANAWLLQWSCIVTLADTADIDRNKGILEFAYTVSFAKDEKGFVTRTVSGTLEIIGYETPAGFASDSCDFGETDYWQYILVRFPKPTYCKRSTSRTLSADRRTLQWTITDREEPDRKFLAPFADWSGRLNVSSPKVIAGTWIVSFSAEYEMADTDDGSVGDFKQLALDHFALMIVSKFVGNPYWKPAVNTTTQRDTFLGGNGDRKKTTITQQVPICLGFEASDTLSGNGVSFSCSYKFTVQDPANGLLAAGFWVPVPQIGAKQWNTNRDITATALSARGESNMLYNQTYDVVVDLNTNVIPQVSPGS